MKPTIVVVNITLLLAFVVINQLPDLHVLFNSVHIPSEGAALSGHIVRFYNAY